MGVFDKLLGGKCEKCGRGFAVKKSKETQEECQKAEIMLQKLIEEIDFS